MTTEWWTFERYGKKGAMGRIDSTIDALGLQKITAKLTTHPIESLGANDVAAASDSSNLPKLVTDSKPKGGRTPKGPSKDPNTDIESLLARSVRERTTADRSLIKRHIGDGDEEDGLGREESAAERSRRNLESDVFDDRPLIQINPVTRMPGELQLSQEEQVYGRTNIHLLVEAPSATDVHPRNPVEEGFYDPARPDVSLWNMDKLIARLTREDRKQEIFFEGGDKHLKMEGYPMNEQTMRAAKTELYLDEPLLHTRIIPPAPYTGKDHWYDFRIQLHALQFTEHELFTREDKLCRELENLCTEYKRRQTINLITYYENRTIGLRALFKAQESEYKQFLSSQPNEMTLEEHALRANTTLSYQHKLLDTLKLIRESIDQREREEYEQRTLFKTIYDLWKEIRRIRSDITRDMKQKGFWASELQPVKSAAAGDVTTRNADQQQPTAPGASPPLPSPPPAAAGPPLLEETYIGYPSNFKVGRHQFDWKNKPEDKLLFTMEKKAWEALIREELMETKLRAQLEEQIKQGGTPVPTNPNEPIEAKMQRELDQKKSDQELYDTIEKRMSLMRRRPGGTKYLPVYNEDTKVIDTSRCLLEEQVRRKKIEEYKVYLRVFVNGMRVCDTEPQTLSFPKFKAYFERTIQLRLVAMPTSIVVQVFHSGGLLEFDEQLAEIGLPIPEFGSPLTQGHYEFAGRNIDPETAIIKHIPTPKQPFPPSRYIGGVLDVSVAWGHGQDKARIGDSKQQQDEPEALNQILANFQTNNRPRLAMRNKMVDFLSGVTAMGGAATGVGAKKLDPNDPRNAEILEHIHRSAAIRGAANGSKPKFIANETQTEGRLTNLKYYQQSARSLVLQVRNESGFIRDPVPLKDEDISTKLYSYIQIRDESSESDYERFLANKSVSADVLYEREQLRAQSKILNVQHDVHSVEEVVNEVALPVLTVNFEALNFLFEKRRDLRPKRQIHKSVSAPKSCQIVIQVVKGQNIPVRRPGDKTSSTTKKDMGNSSSLTLEQQENVRTFVEISLQDTTKRTSCSRGTNPRWDQLISLPFHPPAQSFSPAHLATCAEMIEFNVFDEINNSLEIDPKLTRTRLHQSEQRWLGSFSIPFTTIYNNGKIDGAFSINVPPHLLGYESPHAEREAFLFIYATMDPVLATPPMKPDRFHHMNPFYARAIQWTNDLKARSPKLAKRGYMAVAGDISSQPQFICRYITEERPPDKYQQPNVFRRFVATIPFQEDAQASLGQVKDIWCTSKEFLALQGGDWEEHAILLNNYFTWYDAHLADSGSRHQNYVVLGDGFPEGDTAYVLRLGIYSGAIQSKILINAVTGKLYDLNQPIQRSACPLQAVALVFNADNIWANIQEEDDPTRCSFELYNPKEWHPFFTTNFTKEMAQQQYAMKFDTLQKPIHYTEESFEWYVDRAAKLERMIERRMEKWRSLVTHWDYGVCKVLRDCLVNFEVHAQGESEMNLNMDRPLATLKNAYASIYGFPLHFNDSGDKKLLDPSDDNPIISAVKHTKIHENEDSKAVFALGVYIHPYPNRMGSVWIYIASLMEK